MKEMIHTLKMAVVTAGLAVCLPLAANAQTTSITFDVQPGVPSGTQTQVDILIWTSASPSTFGSATIDVDFNEAAVLNSLCGSSGTDLGQVATDNFNGCLGLGNDVPTCINSNPYGTFSCDLNPSDSGQLRVTVASTSIGTDVGGNPWTIVGLQTGSTQGTASSIARLVFDDVTSAASKSAANFSPYTPADTSLSIGFFDSENNSNLTFTIVDQCAAAPCTFVDSQLPVELSEFTAVIDQEDVVLNWTTASELNNAGFSIEHARGADEEFSELTFIEGAGTTTDEKVYTFRTSGLDIGNHRFRLRQIDFDGAFEYSDVVETTIELAGTHRLGAAYPNPFNPSTTFELVVGIDQQVRIDVINALGQRVQRMFDGPMEANEPTNFVFDARMLPTGLYFYRVVGENFMQTRQMLLVK